MKAAQMLKSIARRLLLLAALSVISVALLVSLGREAIVNLDNYRTQINFFLSEQLAMQVETRQLLGDWQRLKPRITALDLKVSGDGGPQPAVSIDRITLEINLIKTLLARQLVLSELWIGEVALTLTEDADGHWRVVGLPLEDRQRTDSTGLLDMLADSDMSGIGKVSANLQFYSGTEAGIEARDILLESSGDFHRLLAGLSLAGHAPVAELIVEARGDHRDMDDFSASAYLKINRIDFSGSLSALAKGWFPEAVDRVGDISTDIEGEIWIDIQDGGLAMLKGHLSAAEIPLNWVEDVEPLTRFSTDLTGWFKPGDNWGLRLQDLHFEWGELAIEPLTINYLQKVGAGWGEGSVAASQINLSLVDDILAKTGLAQASVLEALDKLQPAGSLRNAHLDLLLDDGQTTMKLRANLDDVAISSWRGSPASRQINGYIEATDDSGLLELDSQNGFAMHYPQVFDDYMEHSSFRGQLRWHWDAANQALKIASGRLDMGGEEGIGRAHLYLDIPIGEPGAKAEMTLLLGIRDSHTKYLPRYLPDNLEPGLLAWINESVSDMALPEVGFVWRGPLEGGGPGTRSIQLYLKTENGKLQFQPDWLPLEQLDSVITLDNGELDAEIRSASIGNMVIQRGVVQLRPAPSARGQQLQIKADISGTTGDAVAVLAQSPLRGRVDGLAGWDISGQSEVALDLMIPLAGNNAEGSYTVDATLQNSGLSLPDSDIAFEQLQGTLAYRDGKGLYGEGVTGKFWGESVVANLSTGEDDLLLDVEGLLAMPALARFINLSSTRILQGKTPVEAKIWLPLEDDGSSIRLQVNSRLEGVGIDLPTPAGKTQTSLKEIQVDVTLAKELDIRIAANGGLRAHLQQKNGVLSRGLLAIHDDEAELPGLGQFRITGKLDRFSLTEWQPYFTELTSENVSAPTALTMMFDVRVDELEVAGLTVDRAVGSGRLHEGDWQVVLDSKQAAGQALIPGTPSSPILLDLEWLTLPTPAPVHEQEAVGGGDESLDPALFPLMQLSIKKFAMGERTFGRVSFRTEPQPDGVLISSLDANLLGLQLGGMDYDTSVLWTLKNGIYATQFDGLFSVGDVGQVMENWGIPPALDSEAGRFFADLHWLGQPWEIAPSTMTGAMSLQLENGRFYKSPSGTANALIRLVGLFNFNNWLRRLQLDFSDLFEKGMSFDELQGGLVFNEGTMQFDPPLLVKMPSGRIKMAGSADLIAEQIDASLVTTLPVGTNLPWVAALIGGLPAAAGVYITSKLFEKQVDKLSSISYRITGPWDDPSVKVQKIFSDKGGAK